MIHRLDRLPLSIARLLAGVACVAGVACGEPAPPVVEQPPAEYEALESDFADFLTVPALDLID